MGLFDGFVKREMLNAGWISKENFEKLSSSEQSKEIENYKIMKDLIKEKADQIKKIYGTSNIGLLRYKFNTAVSEFDTINSSLPGRTSVEEYFLMRPYEQVVLKNEVNRSKKGQGSSIESGRDSVSQRASYLHGLQVQRTKDIIEQMKLEEEQRKQAFESNLENQKAKVNMFFDSVIDAKISEKNSDLVKLGILGFSKDALLQFSQKYRSVYGDDWDNFRKLLNSMDESLLFMYIKYYYDEQVCQEIEDKYIYLSKVSSYSGLGKSISK